MRTLGIFLFVLGITITIRYGYEHWKTMSSVSDYNGEVERIETISKDPSQFETGEQVALLVIPKLNKTYEVYWGTDEETLAKGVGMYVSEWTVTPDENGHTVLSGHRDSVFRPLGELDVGDRFYIVYQGVDYEYEIQKTWITDAEDRTVIVEKDEPIATLSTCYPFTYIGSAPDRYIIQAHLVQKGELLS